MVRKKQVIAGFNRGAKTYDLAAGLQARVAERLATKLRDSLPGQVLEIGCGTGLFSRHLMRKYPAADVLLTDISPSMIAECREKFSKYPTIKFSCVDGESLTPAPAYDLIVSSMTLHWFKEFEQSFTRIVQTLKDRGRFVFAMLSENSLHEWRAMCQKLNISPATPSFPTLQSLTRELPDLQLRVETIKEIYPNAFSFLKTLKSIGAIAPKADHVPLTPTTMWKLLEHFDHEIEITYEVVYGEYHKL
ncbi:MAG: methyltransferase domain-containing protein [Gammaproteobacteria bacterium]